MVTEAMDVERGITRRPYFSAIRWGAVFAGTVAGIGIYLLLMLFGIAVGLTAVEPQAAQPAEGVPIWTGIWSLISMLIAAFVGGWVAGRMSGLRRRMDGMLHGFVSWGLTVLLFAYLTTTALSGLLGGTLGLLGQGLQAAGQVGGGAIGQLQQLITGTPGAAEVTPEAFAALQDQLEAQDRAGAISVMVNQMGFAEERAAFIVDQTLPLFGPEGAQQLQQVAQQAVSTLTAASWWLFITALISLALGIWGGALGARATSRRTVGDHYAERHHLAA